jgi:hypothetical protein
VTVEYMVWSLEQPAAVLQLRWWDSGFSLQGLRFVCRLTAASSSDVILGMPNLNLSL